MSRGRDLRTTAEARCLRRLLPAEQSAVGRQSRNVCCGLGLVGQPHEERRLRSPARPAYQGQYRPAKELAEGGSSVEVVRRNSQQRRRIDWRLAVLGRDDDQGRVIQILPFQFADKLTNPTRRQLNFAQQRRAGRSGGIEDGRLWSKWISPPAFCPTLTAWRFAPKSLGTCVVREPSWFLPSI